MKCYENKLGRTLLYEIKFAPLRAYLAGDAETIIGPDSDTAEYTNMLKESMDEDYLIFATKPIYIGWY